jgi:hypothetical protein
VNSVFKITGTVRAGNEVRLFWTTQTGKTYQLQQSDGLGSAAAWANFGPAVMGTGGMVTQSVGAVAGASRFFRVRAPRQGVDRWPAAARRAGRRNRVESGNYLNTPQIMNLDEAQRTKVVEAARRLAEIRTGLRRARILTTWMLGSR